MLARALLLSVFLLPGPNRRAAPAVPPATTTRQMNAVRAAAGIAAAYPLAAVRDLSRQGIRSSLGTDGRTIDVHIGSRQIAILPPLRRSAPVAVPFAPSKQTGGRAAVVLEPFATELGLGASAGAAEATALQQTGFTVTLLRDSQVTVQSMADLSADSAMYVETHAGRLDDGDAVVATGQTDTSGLSALFKDGSVIQVFVAGDPQKTLYVGVTGTFFADHTNPFLAHSLLFLNGCSVLGDATFWGDLHAHNLATLISWDNDAISTTEDDAGRVIMSSMASGATASQAVQAARDAGLGISIANGNVARLGLAGDGSLTLAGSTTPTRSPAPVPSATPARSPPPPTTGHPRQLCIARYQFCPR